MPLLLLLPTLLLPPLQLVTSGLTSQVATCRAPHAPDGAQVTHWGPEVPLGPLWATWAPPLGVGFLDWGRGSGLKSGVWTGIRGLALGFWGLGLGIR